MLNKYSELKKLAVLYVTCRGLYRLKKANQDLSQYFGSVDTNGNMSEGMSQLQEPQQQTQAQPDTATPPGSQQSLFGGATEDPNQPTDTPTSHAGGASTTEDTPLPMAVNRGMSSAQAMAEEDKRMAASGGSTAAQHQVKKRSPTSLLQQRQISRQQYMQNHQRQIQQAGQQAQQNATKGWFGKAMDWVTRGGYGGWANGRAQAQQQKQLNQRYDQQSAKLKKLQQQARQRMTGAQIQKFLMSRQPQQPTNPVQLSKAGGYNLLNLFPGYRSLLNYV